MIEQFALVLCAGGGPIVALALGFAGGYLWPRATPKTRVVTVLPSMDVALLELAPDGRVATVNDVAPLMFGVAREQLVGKPLKALLPALDEAAGAGRTRWLSGSRGALLGTAIETEAVHGDGTRFPVDVVITTDARGRVVALRDTGREQEVLAAAQRATEEAANVRLAANEGQRVKTRFLANMSHELRTPLNAILGYSEMLRDDLQEAGHAAFVVDTDRVLTAGRRLLQQVEHVLELSRLQSGEEFLCPETFSIATVVEDTVAELANAVASQRNKLEVDVPADLGNANTDAIKVQQVLHHLLVNANKFTHAGTLRISARAIDDDVEFRVTDEGITIPEATRDAVFDAFADVDHTTKRLVGGARVGLALAYGFTHLLGGTLELGPKRDRGAEFVFRIPRQAPPPGSLAPPPPASAQAPQAASVKAAPPNVVPATPPPAPPGPAVPAAPAAPLATASAQVTPPAIQPPPSVFARPAIPPSPPPLPPFTPRPLADAAPVVPIVPPTTPSRPTLVPPPPPADDPAPVRRRRSLLTADAPRAAPVPIPTEISKHVSLAPAPSPVGADPKPKSRRLLSRRGSVAPPPPAAAAAPAPRPASGNASPSAPSVPAERAKILLVDPDPASCVRIARELDTLCHRVFVVSDPREAISAAISTQPRIIALHANTLGADSGHLLDRLVSEPALAPTAIAIVGLSDEGATLGSGAARMLSLPTGNADLHALVAHVPAGRERRVLLVQEPGETRDVLVAMLRRAQVVVDVADDFADALELCGAHPPSLVIADLTTPDHLAVRLQVRMATASAGAPPFVWALPVGLGDDERAYIGLGLAAAIRLTSLRVDTTLQRLAQANAA